MSFYKGTSFAVLTILAAASVIAAPAPRKGAPMPESFYDIKATSLQGKAHDLAQYKGKVTLVVNVASECGYTPQYKGLQALRDDLSGRGFEVLGFPSNEFGGQEPGSPEQIQTFCQKNYGVTFPMFQKLVTKSGPEQSEVYSFLGQAGDLPNWNFCKYVIGKDGQVKAYFTSKVTPEDAKLRETLEKALAE